ncbi:MAG: hypothetical protein II896_02235 [Clostridia bacterium]|nr:hypothetical protein [Clostridia bacterium]
MNLTIRTRKGNYYTANFRLVFVPILLLVAGAILTGIIFGYQNKYEKVYRQTYDAILQSAPEVTVPDGKTAANAVRNCAYSTPELFTVNLVEYISGEDGTVYYFTYNAYAADYQGNLARYNDYIDELMAACPAHEDERDKVKWAHDVICARFEYDHGMQNYSVLSMLDSGKGVCNAYTGLFLALATRLGLQCGVAVSDRMNHTWNIVKVGRNWYHVDVTWDDSSGTYDYYLKTDAEFRNLRHHDWVDTSKNMTYYDNLKIKLFIVGGVALAFSLLLTFAPLLFNYLFR